MLENSLETQVGSLRPGIDSASGSLTLHKFALELITVAESLSSFAVGKVVEPLALVYISVIVESALTVTLVVGDSAQVVGTVGKHKQTLRSSCLHILDVASEV